MMQERPSNRSPAVLATLAAAALSTATASHTGDGGDPEYSSSWFLVRLETAIEVAATDDSFSGHTGLPLVDALILETGVEAIESALPVSALAARFPDALRRHGLDRTYKFFVPVGSDIPALVERFARVPGVEYAEPDYIGGIGGRP
jgi:hypothetical protein